MQKQPFGASDLKRALAVQLCIGIAALVFAAIPAVAGESGEADGYVPQAADYSAASLLSVACISLGELEQAAGTNQRKIQYDAAITALTALYQLHGCEWALEPLLELYSQPDCTPMRTGYSVDGRINLRIEPLELTNTAFEEYTVLLITLTSETAMNLVSEGPSQMRIVLRDGTELEPDIVGDDHPLWPNIRRMSESYVPYKVLESGTSFSFKQVFHYQNLTPGRILAVSLMWGNYTLEIPFITGEVPSE